MVIVVLPVTPSVPVMLAFPLAVTEFKLVAPVTVAAFIVARPLVLKVDKDVAPVTPSCPFTFPLPVAVKLLIVVFPVTPSVPVMVASPLALRFPKLAPFASKQTDRTVDLVVLISS